MDKNNNISLLHQDEETIVAQCTPKGSGALSIIRMSGKDAICIADKISKLQSSRKLSNKKTHTIHFGYVVGKGSRRIDQVLFLLMHGPKTFTGQDTVEITCHNNPFIIENIINEAIANGARLAQNGEFTKRAFLHGKIDIIQAEAINELIHSQTQMALKSSLSQLEGSLSSEITSIETDLLKALSLSEASFEFIEDEDIEFGTQIKKIIEKTIEQIKTLKKTYNQQQQIREGIRIAIVGSVNTGKSSLFNTLLQQKRAIVTDIAGTTRDVIEAGIYKDGNYITLVDTAGIRETDNKIEKEGIERSFDESKKADIIILVYDNARKLQPKEKKAYETIIKNYGKKIIVVANKSDIPENKDDSFKTYKPINISSLQKTNIDTLEKKIDEKIKQLFAHIESPFLLNQRQYNLLTGLKNKLDEIIPLLATSIDYEIVSYHLNDALSFLSEFSGKTITKKSIDLIFKDFCIGK